MKKDLSREQTLLVLANMISNGEKFCVIQSPDYRGGHSVEVTVYEYENKDFEYTLFCGTPKEFAKAYAEVDTGFWEHREPCYQPAVDEFIDAEYLLRYTINYGVVWR